MATKQCPNGHVYDDQRNPVCPYCTGSGDIGVARPLAGPIEAPAFPKTGPVAAPTPEAAPSFPKTSPVAGSAIPKTMPLNNPETNKTMALNVSDKGIEPICGWLICVGGDKKGKDFRIHGGKNHIGRQSSNEICLDFDSTVSKESNAAISYDDRNAKFFIQPGDGKNNAYVNNNLLLTPVELQEYDTIEVGKTKLIFRSLCNENFKWED